MSEVSITVCAYVCMCVHVLMHEMHGGCLVCATWANCVKHKDKDQNMINMIRQDKIKSLELT